MKIEEIEHALDYHFTQFGLLDFEVKVNKKVPIYPEEGFEINLRNDFAIERSVNGKDFEDALGKYLREIKDNILNSCIVKEKLEAALQRAEEAEEKVVELKDELEMIKNQALRKAIGDWDV